MSPKPEKRISEKKFEDLVEHYSQKLVRYVYMKTHNIDTAREIVQECFFRLAKTDYRKICGHEGAWLYRVSKNITVDYLRKHSKWLLEEGSVLDRRYTTLEKDPASSYLESEKHAQVAEVIKELSERDREVMLLKFEGGLSYQAIAEIMKLSVSNVGFIIHQSVRKIRDGVLQAS